MCRTSIFPLGNQVPQQPGNIFLPSADGCRNAGGQAKEGTEGVGARDQEKKNLAPLLAQVDKTPHGEGKDPRASSSGAGREMSLPLTHHLVVF